MLRHAYRHIGVSFVLWFPFFFFSLSRYTSKYLLNALMKGLALQSPERRAGSNRFFFCCVFFFFSSSSLGNAVAFCSLSLVFCSAAAAARKLHFFIGEIQNVRPTYVLWLLVASVCCLQHFSRCSVPLFLLLLLLLPLWSCSRTSTVVDEFFCFHFFFCFEQSLLVVAVCEFARGHHQSSRRRLTTILAVHRSLNLLFYSLIILKLLT